MNPKPVRLALTGTLAIVGMATVAWADCVDGVRSPTSAELAFAQKGAAALAAALPVPIVDSERRGAPYDFANQPRLDFCKGDREGAFRVGVSSGYLYRFPKAEADRRYIERKRIEQQIEEVEKLPPDKEAQYKDLDAKSRAAYASAPRRRRSDPPLTADQQALADKANAEGRRLEDAARKVLSDHRESVRGQTDALKAQAKRVEAYPQELAVRISMNLTTFDASTPLSATFGTPSPGMSAGLRVHNVMLIVDGPDDVPAKTLFGAIDKAYLQALVGKPAPEVAASKALADRVLAGPRAQASFPSASVAGPAAEQGTPAGSTSSAPPPANEEPAPTPSSVGAETKPTEPTQAPRKEPERGGTSPAGVGGASQTVKKLRGILGR